MHRHYSSQPHQHLEERTGCYGHLCEMRVNNTLAVEHIKGKDSYPRLSACRANFLLICTSCNEGEHAEWGRGCQSAGDQANGVIA